MYKIKNLINLKKKIFFSKINLSKNFKKFSKINIKNKKFLRIYILGGGCYGFKYGFHIDKNIKKNDILFKKNNSLIIIDFLSYIYISGSKLDYIKNFDNSKLLITNPNIINNCNCGISFNFKKNLNK